MREIQDFGGKGHGGVGFLVVLLVLRLRLLKMLILSLSASLASPTVLLPPLTSAIKALFSATKSEYRFGTVTVRSGCSMVIL